MEKVNLVEPSQSMQRAGQTLIKGKNLVHCLRFQSNLSCLGLLSFRPSLNFQILLSAERLIVVCANWVNLVLLYCSSETFI